MDEEEANVSFITCSTWVARGVAKRIPDKVGLTQEDLAKIIKETRENIKELHEEETGESKENNEDEETEETVEEKAELQEVTMAEASGEEKKVLTKSQKKRRRKALRAKQKEEEEEENEEPLDFDEDEPELPDGAFHLGKLTVHANNDEDPYVKVKDKDDVDSEDEDDIIKPSDNLIAIGHVEGDAAILEVYLYNAEEVSLYVHHDILLPAVPLCMEWLNYDPTDPQLKPGNMLAIGSMAPVVDVWDLDIADSLEPAYTLGSKGKKKKKISGTGHKEPVLSLAWNTYAEHVLASGSVDQTVILWDLEHGTVAQQINSFEEKVQALKWHHKESHTLLTGACDKKVRIFDCRAENTFKTWLLDGEIESVLWDTLSDNQHSCVVSTDAGTVYGIDARQTKPLWTLKAHDTSCTGISMSPTCPGCLITVSEDSSIKIWDIADGNPSFIDSKDSKIGVIQTLSRCPDLPFVVCMGGDNKENNLKVWDIRESGLVRTRFCPRVGLPTDEDMETEAATNSFKNINIEDDDSLQVVAPCAAIPTPKADSKPVHKFKKKKGGHIAKLKKK